VFANLSPPDQTVNFLAHAYLAGGSDHAIVGSLMGDFVKGPLGGRYGAELTRALVLHRRIDTYTDAHDVVRQSRRRVSPARRRFAGVLVDVFYDHFLAGHWDEYSDVPLERFTAHIYAVLRAHHALLPERLQHIAAHMAAADWLASYRYVDATGLALDRMGQRLKRGNALLRSAEELLTHYAAFEADFRSFFPDVVRFARSIESAHSAV
jgi:acyl carrier protein phosphodiesterase